MPGYRSSRHQYNQAFRQTLRQLNAAQRAAVDQTEGPVLVLAGPGTGKTHILAARIGRILMETDAQAHNILCLTFTDSGVRAMRDRLLTFIGPEAHRVHIYTFHSFCNSIIQDNLERFGQRELEPLSALERVEIIRRLIDNLDLEHPLRRGRSDIYFYEAHLYDLFKRMKTENWSVAYVEECIDAFLADLPQRREYIYQRNTREFKKGDIKQAKLEDARRRTERLRAAVRLYPAYESAMRQHQRYDYDDMILWVLRAFEQDDFLLRTYQEQYLYFLVDEYQDTNGAQNAIIQQLIGFWEKPNIFIVGDDDQSIFEFQGARLKNLTDFYDAYRDDLRMVVLGDNYRSSQIILDSSRALIRHNEERIVNSLRETGLEKYLTARHADFAGSSLAPKLVEYPNRLQEDAGLLLDLEKHYRKHGTLEDTAVIYARHRQAGRLIDLLEKKGLPYATRRSVNILHLPLIDNLRELLEYLDTEFRAPHRGAHLLFRILHFPFFRLPAADLAKVSLYMARQPAATKPFWRDLLRDASILQAAGLTDARPFTELAALLEELLSELAGRSILPFLEKLINRSGMLRYVLEGPETSWRLQVLHTFVDFVRRESERRPRLSITELLRLLDRMEANRLPLELQRVSTAEGGVQLLTAHSAKGLEFRRVYLIDCVQDYWEPSGKRGNYRFKLPDTLTHSGEADAMEARRRLFYVAITRAKSFLQCSFSRADAKGKELRRTRFLDELQESGCVEESSRKLSEAQMTEVQQLQLTEAKPPTLERPGAELLDELLQGFTLSISALNTYLRCPLSFYYEYVLRAPVVQSEAASYGMAAHRALQRLFERMMQSEQQQFPDEAAFLRLFEQELEQQRAYLTPNVYRQKLDMGRRYLAQYYRRNIRSWHRRVKVELNVRNVSVEGVPLTGAIDKVELLEGGLARIVDYKTGRHRAAKLRPPTAAQPQGGSYWRQLYFYKLLFEAYSREGRSARSGIVSFLEPDTDGMFVEKEVVFGADGVALLRKWIRETHRRIVEHDFFRGCGKPDCQWCGFVRRNQAVDSFREEALEELDDR